MRLLGDGPIIDTTKNDENVPKLEIVRNVLVVCNLVQNVYLQDSKILFSFVPNSRFGSLLSITPQVLNIVTLLILFLITFKFYSQIKMVGLYK